MQDQKIENIAAVAVNITKVLVILYLGFVEVFKIGKILREKLDAEFDISRKWASQAYSCLLYTSPSPRDRISSRMPSSA